ncbi:hypothetical protein CR513_12497, partial [Mucuna pruriens]
MNFVTTSLCRLVILSFRWFVIRCNIVASLDTSQQQRHDNLRRLKDILTRTCQSMQDQANKKRKHYTFE